MSQKSICLKLSALAAALLASGVASAGPWTIPAAALPAGGQLRDHLVGSTSAKVEPGFVPVLEKDGAYFYAPRHLSAAPTAFTYSAGKSPVAVDYAGAGASPSYAAPAFVAYSDGSISGRTLSAADASSWTQNLASLSGELTKMNGGNGAIDVKNGSLIAYGKYLPNGGTAPAGGAVLATNVKQLLTIEDGQGGAVSNQIFYQATDGSVHKYSLGSADNSLAAGVDTVVAANAGGATIDSVMYAGTNELGVLTVTGELWRIPLVSGSPTKMVSGIKNAYARSRGKTNSISQSVEIPYFYNGSWGSLGMTPDSFLLLTTDGKLYSALYSNMKYGSYTLSSSTATLISSDVTSVAGSYEALAYTTSDGRAYMLYGTDGYATRVSSLTSIGDVTLTQVAGSTSKMRVTITRDEEADAYRVYVKSKSDTAWTGITTDNAVAPFYSILNPTSGAMVSDTFTLPTALRNGKAFDFKIEEFKRNANTRATKTLTGFVNLPITGVSAAGAVSATDSESLLPISFTDPNGLLDTYAAELVTSPARGTATVVSSPLGQPELSYTPAPDLAYDPANFGQGTFLTDTFSIRGTDAAGNAVTGSATVIINLDTAPVVVSATTSGAQQGDAGKVDLTYDASYAGANRVELVELMDADGTVVASIPADEVKTVALGTTAGGALQPGKGNRVSVQLPAQLATGNYTYSITLASSVAGDFTDAVTSVTVGDYAVKSMPMPALSVSKTALTTEDVVSVKITTPAGSTCAWTYDAAAAQSNSGLCLLTPLGGITATGDDPNTLRGYFNAGVVRVGVAVSRLYQGAMVKFGEVAQDVTVTQAVAPKFVAGTPEQQLAGLGGVVMLEKIAIPFVQTNKSTAPACAIYSDRVAAAQAAATVGRACYVVADQLPAGITIGADSARSGALSLMGRITTEGANPVAVRIFRVNPGMPDTLVDSLNFDLAGKAVLGSGGVTYTLSNTKPNATVDAETISFAGTGLCAQLTTAAAEAEAQQKCLLEVNPGAQNFAPDASKPLAWTGTFAASGVQGIGYTLSAVYGGQKYTVATGTAEASVGVAPLPTVTTTWTALTDANKLPLVGDDGYPLIAVAPNGEIGSVSIKGVAPLVATVTAPGYENAAPVSIASTATVSLTVPLATRVPGTSYPVNVHVAYKNDSKSYLDVKATAVQVPDFKALSIKQSFDSKLSTVGELSITAGVVGGTVYDPLQVGTWHVFPAVLSSDSTLQPLQLGADYTVVSTDAAAGTVTMSIPATRFSSLVSRQNVVTVADYAFGNKVLKRLVSSAVNPTLVDLTPLRSVALSANRSRGAIPFAPTISANVPTTQRAAVGAVEWLLSTDGGANWMSAGTASALSTKITKPGKYVFKAIAHLKSDASITTESAPIEVSAYETPALLMSGKSYGLVSRPLTQELAVKRADGSMADAEGIQWSVVDSRTLAVLATGTGSQVVYTPTVAGNLIIRAAYVGEGANAAVAGEIATKQFGVPVAALNGMVPRLPAMVRVTNRAKVLLEGTGVLRNASVTNAEVGVEWILPAGGKLSGRSASWTVSDEDVAALQAGTPLRMRVWLIGYESETSVTADVATRLIPYAFPSTWALTAGKSLSAKAPAVFQAVAGYDASALSADQVYLLKNEKLTYVWTFPEGMTGRADGATARLLANWKGSYPVSVVITDTRGNTATATGTFTVLDAPDPTIDVTMRGLSINNRTPAEFQVRPSWKRGHALDKLIGYDVLVDGQVVVEGSTQSSIGLSVAGAGDHEVVVVAKSTLATVSSDPMTVTVTENLAPTVTLTSVVSKDGKTASLQAVSKDLDGKIKAISWEKSGVVMKSWAGAERRSVDLTASPTTYQVTVTDDSGESSSSSVTVQR